MLLQPISFRLAMVEVEMRQLARQCVVLIAWIIVLSRPAGAGIAWIGQDGWLRYSPDDGKTVRAVAHAGTQGRVDYNPFDQLVYFGPDDAGIIHRVDTLADNPILEPVITVGAGLRWTIDPHSRRLLAQTSGNQFTVFDLDNGQALTSLPILPAGVTSSGFRYGDVAIHSASQQVVVCVQATVNVGRPSPESVSQFNTKAGQEHGYHDESVTATEFLETGHYIAIIDLASGVSRLALDSAGQRWYRRSKDSAIPHRVLSDALRTSILIAEADPEPWSALPTFVINTTDFSVRAVGPLPFDHIFSGSARDDRAVESLTGRMIGQRYSENVPKYWMAGGVGGAFSRAPFLDGAIAVTFADPGLGVADALTGSDQRYAALGVLDDEGSPAGDQLTFDERVSYLWAGGDERSGLAADGVSTLILRTPVLDRPGIVGWTVEDVSDGENQPFQGPDNGLLRDPFDPVAQWLPGQILTPTITPDGGSAYRGVALLKAPLDFVRPDHKSGDEIRGRENPRKLRISWTFTPVDGTPPSPPARRTIELHRPPVVLLHGLFDRGDSWAWNLPPSIFDVEIGDYRESHGARLLSNVAKEPKRSIARAIAKMHERGIASTQADVFGHSMGGLLSRIYAMNRVPALAGQPEADTDYFRSENLGRGDMHKLITVDTPHQGSQMSDLVVTQDNQPETAVAYWAEYFLRAVGEGRQIDVCDYWIRENSRPNDITAGAVHDMRPDSVMLARMHLGISHAPTHAIVGVPQTDTSSNCYAERTRRMLGLGCTEVGPFEFFGGANDGAVAADSQAGGIAASARSFITGDGGLHGPIIDDATLTGQVVAKAVELLNAPLTGESGAEFTVRLSSSFVPRLHAACGPVLASNPIWSVAVCSTTAPNAWRVCLAALATSAAPPVSVTFISSAGQIVTDNAAPFEADLTAPVGWVGNIAFSAIVDEAGGTRSAAQEGSAWVNPPTGLNSIRFDRPEIVLSSSAQTGESWVRGMFSDGIERNLSVPGIAIQFSVDDESIAGVDANGLVTARRVGTATLTATFGGRSATVPIQVLSAKGDWDRNGAVDLFDSQAFDVLFSGPSGQSGFVKPGSDALAVFDFDGDGDIDCADWQVMRGALTGPPYVFPLSARCEPGRPVKIETLAPLSYCGFVTISGMSSDGRVAVGYRTNANCNQYQSVIWPLGSDAISIPQISGLDSVSANGAMAFSYGTFQHSFVVPLSTLLPIPIEPAPQYLDSVHIADDGSVVLCSGYDYDDTGNHVAYIWRTGIGWTTLPGVPTTWIDVFAYGMSENGQRIAGGYRTASATGIFVLDLNAGMSVLPLPAEYQSPGWAFTPSSVFLSDDGRVVTTAVANAQQADVVQYTFGAGWALRLRNANWLRQVSPSGETLVIAPQSSKLRLYSPRGVAEIEENLFYSAGLVLPGDWWGSSSTLWISDGASVILGNKPYWAAGATRISPAPPACPQDLNGDRVINTLDLILLLQHFGQNVPVNQNGDINADATVNTLDLILLLQKFGQACP